MDYRYLATEYYHDALPRACQEYGQASHLPLCEPHLDIPVSARDGDLAVV
jgi:hypothetical protein